MSDEGIYCPNCGSFNHKQDIICSNCDYSFSKTNKTSYNGAELESYKDLFNGDNLKTYNKFFFQRNFEINRNFKTKGGKSMSHPPSVYMYVTDNKDNNFTITKSDFFFLYFTLMIVFVIFLGLSMLVVPLEYYIIFYPIAIYLFIYFFANLQHFNIVKPESISLQYDMDNSKNNLVGKIIRNKKFFQPKSFIQPDDYVFIDSKKQKLITSHFAYFYQGTIQRNQKLYYIEAIKEGNNNYYRDIKGYRIFDKNNRNLILIKNKKMGENPNPLLRALPKDFEIYSLPEVDENTILYSSFIIIKKYLNLR